MRLTPIDSSEEKINERIKMPNFNYKIIIVIYMVIMSIIGLRPWESIKNEQSIKNGAPLKKRCLSLRSSAVQPVPYSVCVYSSIKRST